MKTVKPKFVYSILAMSAVVVISFLVTVIIYPGLVNDSSISLSLTAPTVGIYSTIQPGSDELIQ